MQFIRRRQQAAANLDECDLLVLLLDLAYLCCCVFRIWTTLSHTPPEHGWAARLVAAELLRVDKRERLSRVPERQAASPPRPRHGAEQQSPPRQAVPAVSPEPSHGVFDQSAAGAATRRSWAGSGSQANTARHARRRRRATLGPDRLEP